MRIFLSFVFLCAAAISPALAQFAPAPVGTTIDLMTIVNPLMQLVGSIILLGILPLIYAFTRKMLNSWGIEATAEMAAVTAMVDGIAQKAIGGSIAKYAVKPGQITVDVKSNIIKDAADTLVKNAGESLTKLGVPDSEKIIKAREMIASRIGLMDATAAGNPVPNPSQPAVVAVPAAQPTAPTIPRV